MERSLKQINSILLIFILILIGCLTPSCKKEKAPSTSSFFMKTYDADSATEANFIKQMPDGGFLIIGSEGAGRPVLIRTDRSGKQLWTKIVNTYYFSLSSAPHWWTTQISPNLFSLQGGLYITNIDTSGNVLKSYFFYGFQYWWNGPVLQTGLSYFVPYCAGWIGVANTANDIFVLNQNLKFERIDTFHDTRIGGQIILLNVYGVTNSGAYNIWGEKYTSNSWTYNDNAKLFIARIPKTGPVIQTIIDGNDNSIEDGPEFHISGPNSNEILLANRQDFNTIVTYPIVVEVDSNLNVVWKNTFPTAEGSVYSYDISPCRDGGFIICGSIQKLGYTERYPYAMKIDANGNPLWSKTFDTKDNGEFNYGIATADGGYAFVGYTNAFGKTKNGNRILFVKTDANGNL